MNPYYKFQDKKNIYKLQVHAKNKPDNTNRKNIIIGNNRKLSVIGSILKILPVEFIDHLII